MNQRSLLLALCVAAVLLVIPVAADACAVCLTGAASGDPTTDAYNWSVLFLMAMPYTVVGSIGGWLAYNYWRAAAMRGGPGKKAPVMRLAWTQRRVGDE